jgi:hypothetical protein
MSSNLPINNSSDITAPTPQNTPLSHAPISAGLSRPTVPDISEDAEPAEEATTTVHEAMFGLVQGRLAGLLGKSSGYIESLPDGAKKTIEALKGVQIKQNDLQNQYKRECLELEKKACHACPLSSPLHPSIHPFPPCPCFSYPILIAGRVRTMHYSVCGTTGVLPPFSHPFSIAFAPKSGTIDASKRASFGPAIRPEPLCRNLAVGCPTILPSITEPVDAIPY